MISSKIVSFLAAALGAGSALASAIPALEKRQRAPGASITYYKDENFQGDKQFFDKDRKDMQCCTYLLLLRNSLHWSLH